MPDINDFVPISEMRDIAEIKRIFIILQNDKAIMIDSEQLAKIINNPLLKPAITMILKN